jgi:hypothetical protein
MALRSVLTTMALATLLAAPAGADQHERHRQKDNRNQSEEPARARDESGQGERAVPRAEARREAQPQPPRQDQSRQDQARIAEQQRIEQTRRADNNRNSGSNRRYDDNRRYDNDHRFDSRWYGNSGRHYDSHSRYYYYFPAPRVIRPTIIRVVPYQPYVYHPSFSLGVYYGSGGYYPYGYTPRGYYEPLTGRLYGGVRITGAPRDARVFADGYFVGLVDDFDGIFQHVNLEAGPHHLEVEWGGYQPIAFDVYVRPGETTTFRADGYFRY